MAGTGAALRLVSAGRAGCTGLAPTALLPNQGRQLAQLQAEQGLLHERWESWWWGTPPPPGESGPREVEPLLPWAGPPVTMLAGVLVVPPVVACPDLGVLGAGSLGVLKVADQ